MQKAIHLVGESAIFTPKYKRGQSQILITTGHMRPRERHCTFWSLSFPIDKVPVQRTAVTIRGDELCRMFHTEIGLEPDVITGR